MYGGFEVSEHCSIGRYLEQDHKLFKELADSCCLSFKGPRGGGVTVLVPDKKTVDKMVASRKSNGVMPVANEIRALILPMFVETITDFEKYEIKNQLGRTLDVVSATEMVATLKNGAEITPDEGFKFGSFFDSPQGIALYTISGLC